MTSIRIRVILFFLILACIFVGVLIYQARTSTEEATVGSTPEQISVDTAEKPVVPMNFGNVVGTVKSISGDTLTVTVQKYIGDTTDQKIFEYVISISPTTKIVRSRHEDARVGTVSSVEDIPLIMRPQIDETTDQNIPLPKVIQQTKIDFSDIKVDEMVYVVLDTESLKKNLLIAEMIELFSSPNSAL